MKRSAQICLSLCLKLVSAQSQPGSATLIESRQAEVFRLAPFYFIDVTHGVWNHQQIGPCPSFTHHVFARYERSPAQGIISSFVAIYSVNAPAGRSDKPWTSGIQLIPVETFSADPQSVAERHSTLLVFNRVWADELKESGHPDRFPALDWGGLAACYAAISGERVSPPQVGSPESHMPPSINLVTNPASSVMISVVGKSAPRSLRLAFDSHGMITDAKLI